MNKNKKLRTVTTVTILIKTLAVALLILKPALVSSIVMKTILVVGSIYTDIFTMSNLTKNDPMKNGKNALIMAYTIPVICADTILTFFVLFKYELFPLPTSLNITWIVSLIYIAIFAYANLAKKKNVKIEKKNKIRKIEFDDSNNIRIIK